MLRSLILPSPFTDLRAASSLSDSVSNIRRVPGRDGIHESAVGRPRGRGRSRHRAPCRDSAVRPDPRPGVRDEATTKVERRPRGRVKGGRRFATHAASAARRAYSTGGPRRRPSGKSARSRHPSAFSIVSPPGPPCPPGGTAPRAGARWRCRRRRPASIRTSRSAGWPRVALCAISPTSGLDLAGARRRGARRRGSPRSRRGGAPSGGLRGRPRRCRASRPRRSGPVMRATTRPSGSVDVEREIGLGVGERAHGRELERRLPCD